jgi:formylglycine-generating enzyme required for sulfatase activity
VIWVVAALLLSAVVSVAWHLRGRLLGDEQIVVRLQTVPADAEVYLDGARILPPIHLQATGQVFTVTVKARGYQPRILSVVANRDQTHRVTLARLGKATRRRPRAHGAARASTAGRCPAGMRRIPGHDAGDAGDDEGFCIDRHEFPGRGRQPRRGVTLAGARSACHARGKRLCTVTEWVRACGEGRFPYGASYRAGRCTTGGRSPARAGSKRGCRSRWGIYDLSGNVSEWVAEGVTMGGDASQEGGLVGCRASSDRGGPLAGFRCCADPAWD